MYERVGSRELITRDEENPEDLAGRFEQMLASMSVDTVNHEYCIRIIVDRLIPQTAPGD